MPRFGKGSGKIEIAKTRETRAAADPYYADLSQKEPIEGGGVGLSEYPVRYLIDLYHDFRLQPVGRVLKCCNSSAPEHLLRV
jgi:hypothetical protein